MSLSGDTIFHPGFVAASEGVDLMLHEALDPEMVGVLQAAFERNGQNLTAKIMQLRKMQRARQPRRVLRICCTTTLFRHCRHGRSIRFGSATPQMNLTAR